MNTDSIPSLTHPRSSKLLFQNETRQLIGFAFDVLNEVGHGLNEKIYENSLVVLLKENEIAFHQQRHFPVLFRQVPVGEFIPDLVAFGAVIVDAKVIDQITDRERGQMLNYLRITRLRVGLILNFKHAKLEWERVVL